MDKKIYFSPEAEIVEIETQGFIAASLGGSSDDNVLNKDDNGEGGENFNPDLF